MTHWDPSIYKSGVPRGVVESPHAGGLGPTFLKSAQGRKCASPQGRWLRSQLI